MPDLNKLVFQVSDALEKRSEPPAEPELRNLIAGYAGLLEQAEGEPYSAAQIEEAMRRLQTEFTTRMGLGTLFEAEDYRPWLPEAQGDIVPYYWTRYRKHLRREGLSKQVVGTLDRVTDEILDHLENPKKEGRWARKGLVVGHVQSGKTANYTGLVAKAADAGYKVIIVLAGMLNSLRNQTQERIDTDFIGLDTITKRPVGVALFDSSRQPICFTTAREDFKKHTATSIAMKLGSLKEPVLLVLKKNPSTLENLHDWLSKNNLHDLKDFPVLLIDDEADHASINTNKPESDPTTINRWIRDVLALFPRCSFVGYTATPFANIFIDPETEDEMTKSDLFPRDFILSLDPPTNYVGASQLFLEEGGLDCIREINDHEDLLPTGHKITLLPTALPTSLIRAIDAFVIAKTIRLLRKQTGQHHSMMINVSRFTGVQNLLTDLVLAQVKLSRQAIGNYSALAPETALQNSVIRRLHKVWTDEYSGAGFGWPEVQAHLKDAVDPVEVISINIKGSGILDYGRKNYPSGRSLIAVGGLSLSRGLTLQGLIATYFLRNSIMYDTLMQMGRWFGYRDGYADLCRIHMTAQTTSWYAHIAEAIEELRSDFEDMKAARMTPLEFGLRVRAHPTALIVTARNKMRAARDIPVSISLEGRLAETSVLLANPALLVENRHVLEALVRDASAIQRPTREKLGWFWRNVPNSLAKAVVSGFQNHPECMLTHADPLLEYINWLEQEGQKTFDVLLRSAGDGNYMVSGLPINPIDRTVPSATSARIEFNKRRVASRGDERAGLKAEEIERIAEAYIALNPGKDVPDKEYRKFRQQSGRPPLLMAMFARIETKDGKVSVPDPVAAYGIGFPGDPGSQRRARKLVHYRVNTTWWEKNVLNAEEEEEIE